MCRVCLFLILLSMFWPIAQAEATEGRYKNYCSENVEFICSAKNTAVMFEKIAEVAPNSNLLSLNVFAQLLNRSGLNGKSDKELTTFVLQSLSNIVKSIRPQDKGFDFNSLGNLVASYIYVDDTDTAFFLLKNFTSSYPEKRKTILRNIPMALVDAETKKSEVRKILSEYPEIKNTYYSQLISQFLKNRDFRSIEKLHTRGQLGIGNRRQIYVSMSGLGQIDFLKNVYDQETDLKEKTTIEGSIQYFGLIDRTKGQLSRFERLLANEWKHIPIGKPVFELINDKHLTSKLWKDGKQGLCFYNTEALAAAVTNKWTDVLIRIREHQAERLKHNLCDVFNEKKQHFQATYNIVNVILEAMKDGPDKKFEGHSKLLWSDFNESSIISIHGSFAYPLYLASINRFDLLKKFIEASDEVVSKRRSAVYRYLELDRIPYHLGDKNATKLLEIHNRIKTEHLSDYPLQRQSMWIFSMLSSTISQESDFVEKLSVHLSRLAQNERFSNSLQSWYAIIRKIPDTKPANEIVSFLEPKIDKAFSRGGKNYGRFAQFLKLSKKTASLNAIAKEFYEKRFMLPVGKNLHRSVQESLIFVNILRPNEVKFVRGFEQYKWRPECFGRAPRYEGYLLRSLGGSCPI